MKPYYQSKTVTIWNGSMFQIPIPESAVCITDPPYNIGKPQLIQKFKGQKTVGRDFGEDFDTDATVPQKWVPRMPDTVACFYGAKGMLRLLRSFKANDYEVVQDFHWCKPNAPPPLRGIGFAWGTESGYVFRKIGTKHIVNKQAGYSPNFMVASFCKGKERGIHTTQKPLRVMKWLVRFFSVRESVIADPFLGSGTVGVASVELGRKFIGIEQQERYCEIAAKRIEAAMRFRRGLMLDS